MTAPTVTPSLQMLYEQALQREHDLRAEMEEAQQEAAFLYQFAQEVNSATSIQEVADAVLRSYSTVEGVYIQIWEHLDFDRASHYVIAGAAVRGDAMLADRGSIYHKSDLPDFYERVRQEGIWKVEDSDADPRVDPWLRQVYASIHVRATLVLPMLQGTRWLASVSFRYSKPYVYTPRDLRLMRGIRDVVFSAVERIESQEAMRLALIAEQDARAESEALYRVSEDINAANSFHDIVRAVDKLDFGPGDIYLNLFENYNYEGARYFDIVATANDAFDHEGERWWISEFSLVHKFPRQGVFINENIPENPNIDEESKAQFLRLGVQSNMRVSLSLHGRWMGGLGLDSALPRNYSDREKRLMAGVGDLVAAAVERIRLQQESEQSHRRAQELVALEERNRLARELHDSVSQALYGIGLGARTAQAMWEKDNALVKESINYMVTLAEAALVEMRALIFELRPDSLEHEGLVTVLSKQAASLQTRHGLDVCVHLCDEPALPLEVKESLFRIAREALHNIVKHAGATNVTLYLLQEDSRLKLEISDNGVGFDSTQDFHGHLGLQSMRERMAQLGGTIVIDSAPSKGTRLTAQLSLNGI
ncbi:MAG: GAF domain-containing sensor histidine kinase [Chloroflexota bacterium]|nr:GAF domain-containing sensor histidine kinase [Chloroflexota bacterium]